MRSVKQPNPFALVTIIVASAVLIYSLFPQFGGPSSWFIARIVLMPALLISGCYLGIIAEDRKYGIGSDVRWVFSKLPFAAMVFIAIIVFGLQFKPPQYPSELSQGSEPAVSAGTSGSYVLPIVLVISSLVAVWLYRTSNAREARTAGSTGGIGRVDASNQTIGDSSAAGEHPLSDDLARRKSDLEFDLLTVDADLVRLYRDPDAKRVLEKRKHALLQQLEELRSEPLK
jgi:hypothetical protein